MAKNAEKILLGLGLFKINGSPVGLTRGGGKFTVERTFRDIVADGDKGAVKGRVTLDESRPKLTMNLLQIVAEDLPSMYPATKTKDEQDIIEFSAKKNVTDDDYVDIEWVGTTKDGKACQIIVKNALNKENLDWTMQEKNEIIPVIVFEGHYEDDGTNSQDEDYEPWSIKFTK